MGVTYSWLKRRSARAKPVSPGLTLRTPTSAAAAEFRSAGRAMTPVPTWSVSVGRIMWRAKIFSATVIGRRSSAP